MANIFKQVLLDILKNRIVLVYTFILAILSWSVFSLEDNSGKGIQTILSVVLLVVPLVSVIFSTIYVYNSTEFIELLVSQPVKRSKIWRNFFLGLCFAMVFAFLVSTGIPLLLYVETTVALMMILMGSAISCVFVSIAFLCATLSRDKAKGIGIAIALWLFFSLLFDGLLLFLAFQFSEYPIEKAMVFASAFNPLDMARILILLQLDSSVMMGYTGAIFRDFFGTEAGLFVALAILAVWFFVPFYISLIKFCKKDL